MRYSGFPDWCTEATSNQSEELKHHRQKSEQKLFQFIGSGSLDYIVYRIGPYYVLKC